MSEAIRTKLHLLVKNIAQRLVILIKRMLPMGLIERSHDMALESVPLYREIKIPGTCRFG